jgi:hypothetical protein
VRGPLEKVPVGDTTHGEVSFPGLGREQLLFLMGNLSGKSFYGLRSISPSGPAIRLAYGAQPRSRRLF